MTVVDAALVERVFAAEEFEARIAAVRAEMAARGMDALLVTSPENIYYLLGLSHQGYFAFTMLVLPASGRPALVTRDMERITVANQAPEAVHVGFGDGEEPASAVARCVRAHGLAAAALGVEKDHMFFPPKIWEEIQRLVPDARWRDGSGTVDGVRFPKSPAELAYVRRAAAVTQAAMQAGIDTAAAGVNEQEVVAEIYRAMVLAGGEYPGFAPLVRSSDTLDEEHSTWRDRVLRPGDRLFIELSGSVRRYHAPMSRIVNIGAPPRAVATAAVAARVGLEAVFDAVRPGALTGDVYAAWEAAVGDHLGVTPEPRHHCGYSVGIGFPPSWVGGSVVIGIRPGGKVEIREGMVFHLFSWVAGSARAGAYVLSETALVAAAGAAALHCAPRGLIVR